VDKLTTEDRATGGFALLTAVSLLFFPWFSISAGPLSFSFSGTSSPDGWLGVIGMLAALAVLADLAVETFSPQTQLPALAGGRRQTRFMLAALAAACIALKFILHIHFSLFGWGFYVSVLAGAALLFTTLKATGGTVSLPSMRKRPAA
jgi:hypothetical protein